MKNKLYITTPIYYVNAAPHIGHSYTTIAADCLIRHARQRLGNDNVWFLTGTDEHGQKIQKAAESASVTAQEFVDKVVVQFEDLWLKLGVSYSDFIRTTQKRHTTFVQRALDIVYQKGDIYLDTYEGWYCTPCETFWPQSQIVEQFCPDCQRPVEKITEQNYFFRLSKYQSWLIDYIRSHPGFIRPQIREAEVLSFLTLHPLTDLCISRPKERLNWGIPLPFSPEHVTYVWFDALINYISAVGSFNEQGVYSSPWWASDSEVVHLIGKDILRQHAVYWPIMLQALG
nr:methionine--tRNA ligase [Candidatus Omnitrophota bacterium]